MPLSNNSTQTILESTKILEQIESKITSVFYLKDPIIVRLVISTILTNYMKGSPVWLMIVGSSSVGKSEMIKLLYKCKRTESVSTLTDNTLLSGMRTKKKGGLPSSKADAASLLAPVGASDPEDPSLLHRIGDKGVIIMKDFTTILGMSADKKTNILSQLREVFDGRFSKETGVGKVKPWKGKLNMVAATTEEIYDNTGVINNAGPRFIYYELRPLNNQEIEKRKEISINFNAAETNRVMEECQDLAALYTSTRVSQPIPAFIQLPYSIKREIYDCAYIAAAAQTPVKRNPYLKNRIEQVFNKTLGDRLARQSLQLLSGLALMRPLPIEQFNESTCGTAIETPGICYQITKDDMSAVVKAIFDSIPRLRHYIMRKMAALNKPTRASELEVYTGVSAVTCREIMEELSAIEIAQVVAGAVEGGVKSWQLAPNVQKVIQLHYPGIEDELQTYGGNLEKVQYNETTVSGNMGEIDDEWLQEAADSLVDDIF